MREDAERIDLDGQPAGKVDAQSAEHAHRKLDRLQGEKRNGQGRKHPGRQNERHNHKGRGQPAKAGSQDRAHGKPKDGAKGRPSSQGKGTSAGPVRERAEPAPVTMEEKLSALLAKHNGR